ncbi:response regulator [Verrucomicrobium sp. BvORR034]|jgi:DNA-binding response OmpR family regulator|uniref:response regulator transcription factor n=1 Tax=Verrucomicrobium sp. BvORR034 TaxID=1396418 RepID=UPI0006799456|nr:response regulator [Verrucomicrobium sp. BvORR034]
MTHQVLLADDDPLLHRVVGFKVAQQQWQLISAYNGAEALEQARLKRPSVIILDGMMPVMDGFEALRELRRDPLTASIPVLMLSARNRDADVVGALDQGANDYLTKPFSPAELVARVSRLIPGGAVA